MTNREIAPEALDLLDGAIDEARNFDPETAPEPGYEDMPFELIREDIADYEREAYWHRFLDD
jgi:hypothetical protein